MGVDLIEQGRAQVETLLSLMEGGTPADTAFQPVIIDSAEYAGSLPVNTPRPLPTEEPEGKEDSENTPTPTEAPPEETPQLVVPDVTIDPSTLSGG